MHKSTSVMFWLKLELKLYPLYPVKNIVATYTIWAALLVSCQNCLCHQLNSFLFVHFASVAFRFFIVEFERHERKNGLVLDPLFKVLQSFRYVSSSTLQYRSCVHFRFIVDKEQMKNFNAETVIRHQSQLGQHCADLMKCHDSLSHIGTIICQD